MHIPVLLKEFMQEMNYIKNIRPILSNLELNFKKINLSSLNIANNSTDQKSSSSTLFIDNKDSNINTNLSSNVNLSKVFIDCTFGAGGYSFAILSADPNFFVIAFDIDKQALKKAEELRKTFPDRFRIINSNFANLQNELERINVNSVDCIIADLGVSSMQIDSETRGFSFMREARLDMRMGPQELDAHTVINTFTEEKLADIIYYFGEERFSRRIAKNIILTRQDKPINTTLELKEVIKKSIPYTKSKIDPATKTFQAIRIFVNNELENLKELLSQSRNILKNNGLLGIVSFHSLEDKIVKDFIKDNSEKKIQASKYKHNTSKDHINADNNLFDIRSHKLIAPTREEVLSNPRSRSAKLRIIKKI